jgi:hypothetical protein
MLFTQIIFCYKLESKKDMFEKTKKKLYIKIIGGEKMVETQQASGGSLVGLAIIFLIILLLFPAFAIWLLYVAIVVMLIAGIVSLIAG